MIDIKKALAGPFVFVPPQPLIVFDALPDVIRRQLELNTAYSARFVADAGLRHDWFNARQFRLYPSICSDGRCSDLEQAFGEGRGIPAGVIKVNRSAGGINNHASLATCQIVEYRAKRARRDGKKIIVPQFAHWSSSHPKSASCAALEHDTDAALRVVQYSADEMNYVAAGDIVSFAALLDTDYDSMQIIGPNGRFDTLELAREPMLPNEVLPDLIEKAMRDCFHETWTPFQALGETYREAFYRELPVYLTANVIGVRDIIKSGRAAELINHEERLLVVGRNVMPALNGYNSVFLCDDHSLRLRTDFEIGLRFVTANSAIDAARTEQGRFTIPILVNAPYNRDNLRERRRSMVNARHLRERLEAYAQQAFAVIKTDTLSALCAKDAPGRARELLASLNLDQFMASLGWCTCVSARETRRLEPFT